MITPLYKSRTASGYSTEVQHNPAHVVARKRPFEVRVEFADREHWLDTPEGQVTVNAGDAIVEGPAGERWAVPRQRFEQRYSPVPPTRAGDPGPYASTGLEVLAIQMQIPFAVLLSDGLSRLDGHPGDWLVDYGDGHFGVVGRDIFRDTYDVSG